MRLKFLGGADEVGRLGMLVEEDGKRLLFDYGLSATDPPKYPMEAPPIDFLLLSHAHLDHSGMVPWICSRYHNPVIANIMTQQLSEVLFEDSVKISDLEGYPQMYDANDIRATKRNFDNFRFGDRRRIGPFQTVFHSAGHIPGSTMFELRGKQTVLFTGDINTINTRLLTGTKPVKCDTLIIEGTYSGRNHPGRVKLEYEFIEKVNQVVSRGGKAIIPAFAIGRTQELMLILKRTKHHMFVDGMGNTITDIYLRHPKFLRSAKDLRRMRKKVKMVRSARGRKYALKGNVIITTSGMLDGGPILTYIENLGADPKNAILLTGYQVEGSNGRLLMDERKIDIQGVKQSVNCEVCFFDFSAHSGHQELIRFVHGCEPKDVIICHSDNRRAMADELKGSYNVLMPKLMEQIDI